jgi:hypothetical protein
MSLPVARNSVELSPDVLGTDYVAMSISPLVYEPYTRNRGAATLGYAGVATTPQGLVTVARLANYDTSTSFEMMRNWLEPAAQVCLPESYDYADEMLEAITDQVGSGKPLALFQLEDEGKGDRRISLAARKALGVFAIKQKVSAGTGSSIRKSRGIQRRMGNEKLAARQAFGEGNYEALVVGSALMLRLFGLPVHNQIPPISQPKLTR